MINIDGSKGEGGGQMLRTSVALSAVTGEPVRIFNIRSKRENPGLRPQHLTAAKAAAQMSDAKVEGLEVGSTEVSFTPRKIIGGHFRFDVGTAGSTPLLFQAILPVALSAPQPVSLTLIGGTDVSHAPSSDYVEKVFLPLLSNFGANVEFKVKRRGYYPAGGGIIEAEIQPLTDPKPLVLLERGNIESIHGVSHAHKELAKRSVAERQSKSARTPLYNSFHMAPSLANQYVDSLSLGSGITLWGVCKNSTIGACALGGQNISSETVGLEAANLLTCELNSGAAVDSHLADQIIPYIALYGGEIQAAKITRHCETNMDVARQFKLNIKAEGNIINGRR
ncbi:RNA 3'-terminal phosphate cyclase [uncultured archaeon]|nr:RNA 3'-terminal phosphate cyclase [uncultured archaeon]